MTEPIPDDMFEPIWLSYKPEDKIKVMCARIEKMLLDKNTRYGNSSLSGKSRFGLPKGTSILARIDDKLSRLDTIDPEKHPDSYADTIKDLTGYLILYMIHLEDEENERCE